MGYYLGVTPSSCNSKGIMWDWVGGSEFIRNNVSNSELNCASLSIGLTSHYTMVQWGSEIRTSLNFKWSKEFGLQIVWISNGI